MVGLDMSTCRVSAVLDMWVHYMEWCSLVKKRAMTDNFFE